MESKTHNLQKTDKESLHYFTLFQQLTLMGFFTSEAGYTQVLRFEMVPGAYKGCVDYKKGETALANG